MRSMCTVLNFYLSDTKRKRRVGFMMLSNKSAQCFSQVFIVLHQLPEGRILQIFRLQNPSVALPQYHLYSFVGKQLQLLIAKLRIFQLLDMCFEDSKFQGLVCQTRAQPSRWRFLSPTFSIDLLHIYL